MSQWDYEVPKTLKELEAEHLNDMERFKVADLNLTLMLKIAYAFCLKCPHNRQLICNLFGDPYNGNGDCLWEK